MITIKLKKIDGDAYEIPFAHGWKRFAAIRFALELAGARKADLEWFLIEEVEL